MIDDSYSYPADLVVADEATEWPVKKLPKGKQPRRNQDRSKYQPHQNKKECERRILQLFRGQLEMAGSAHAYEVILNAALDKAHRVSKAGPREAVGPSLS